MRGFSSVMLLAFVVLAQFVDVENTPKAARTSKEDTAVASPPLAASAKKSVHDFCVAESGVSEFMITRTVLEFGKFKVETEFKCYVACVFDRLGLLPVDGEVHLEKLIGLVPDSRHGKAIRQASQCLVLEGSSECDRAFSLFRCLKMKDTENTLFSSH